MTTWQIIVISIALGVFVIASYHAGRRVGELEERAAQDLRRQTDDRSEPYYKKEWIKSEAARKDWKSMHDSLLLEVQRLNKAVTRRNRRIAALRRAQTVSDQPGSKS